MPTYVVHIEIDSATHTTVEVVASTIQNAYRQGVEIAREHDGFVRGVTEQES